MKKSQLLFLILFFVTTTLASQTIVVSGNKFQVDGKDIYINGVNAPWQWQSDCDINFMRKNFDANYWDAELQKYIDANANVVRVWIHGSGNYSPALDGNGYVTAYPETDQFWKDMDALVALAESKKIYLMPTFWSFDMASTNSWYYSQYRQILTDDNKAGSYINNFLIPFVTRYKDNQWIMGYDLCNEPEHIWRDANCGNLSDWWVTRFFARCAIAVHNNCSQPVTIGAMWAIYNSNTLGTGDGDNRAGYNRYSDANMKNYFDDPMSYLDFYSPHWYQWQGSNGPFNRTVSQWIGSDDKPVITGETYGGDLSFITMADFYNHSYTNGFDGVMGWKNACQNDGYGTWAGVEGGLSAFYNQHPELVFPYIQEEPNIAHNKPTYSSSEESSTYASSNAVDENASTRWASDWDDEQWIYIDLQADYDITQVKLLWESAYATQYQIQVSDDNISWTTVYSNYAGTGGTNNISLATSGRYIKMYAWQRATSYGYSLYEFKVNGTPKISTSIKSQSETDSIQLFPNPVDDVVTISGIENVTSINILNLAGKVMEKYESKNQPSFTFDVTNYSPGLYISQLKEKNRTISKYFIVK